MTQNGISLILASASLARQRMLAEAGVVFTSVSADIDETRIKSSAEARDLGPAAMALALAEAKAVSVSRRHPEALVIGADQVLECQGHRFDKPADEAEAAATLVALRGKTHRLISAVAAARGGTCTWQYADTAWLTMRLFSDAFLRQFVGECGADMLQSVGAYRIEGPGVHLFSRIEGDHFVILGLPLLPLLGFLRREHILAE